MIKQRQQKKGRRAATVVETAFVLSVCLVFVLAIFEFGRLLMMRNLLDNAAREGARQAVTNTNTLTTSDIQATVTSYLAGQQFQTLTILVYQVDPATGNNIGAWNSATYGNTIAVEIDAAYQPMLPGMGWLAATVNLKSKAIMRSESS
jgi:Flp pilus assembly protein TadG